MSTTTPLDVNRFVRAEEAGVMAYVRPATLRDWNHRGLFDPADVWQDPKPPHVTLYRLGAVLDVEAGQRRRRRRARS
jgi:hypothetical protein